MRAAAVALIVLSIFSALSAITGIQSVRLDPQLGRILTYHHGYTRLYALAFSAGCAALTYAVYRRHIVAWWLGFVPWIAGCSHMVWKMWPDVRQAGLPIALISSAFIFGIGAFWSFGWYRQRDYFDHDAPNHGPACVYTSSRYNLFLAATRAPWPW